MTALEERLRQDLCSEAGLIHPDTLVRLRLPELAPLRSTPRRQWRLRLWPHRARRTPQRRGLRRAPGWARPLVSTAAVAAVSVGPLVGMAQANAVSLSGLARPNPNPPKYYAYTVPQLSFAAVGVHALTFGSNRVAVARAGTGHVVTTFSAPAPYNDFTAITANATGTAFVLAVVRRTWQGGSSGRWNVDQKVPLLLLHLTVAADGRTGLSVLSTPTILAAPTAATIALSPAGSRLAIAYRSGQDAVIQVLTLATGAVREWSWTHVVWAPSVASAGGWTANGATLAFRALLPANWPTKGASQPAMVGLISTQAPPHGSVSSTFLAFPPLAGAPMRVEQVFLTPDGNHLITSTVSHQGTKTFGRLAEYSTRTGALQGISGRWWISSTAQASAAEVIAWSNDTGSQLVVTVPVGRRTELGVLNGDWFTTDGFPVPSQPAAYHGLQSALAGVSADGQPAVW